MNVIHLMRASLTAWKEHGDAVEPEGHLYLMSWNDIGLIVTFKAHFSLPTSGQKHRKGFSLFKCFIPRILLSLTGCTCDCVFVARTVNGWCYLEAPQCEAGLCPAQLQPAAPQVFGMERPWPTSWQSSWALPC